MTHPSDVYQSELDTAASRWDAFASNHVDSHVLQSADWGSLKSAFGWTAQRITIAESDGKICGGARVLYRTLPLRMGTLAYIPAGPLFANDDPHHTANMALWQALDVAMRSRTVAFLKVEPCDWYRPRPDLPTQLEAGGLHRSLHTIQPPRTIAVELTPDKESVLKRMNQSTRRKVKLGPKMEVEVRQGTRDDLISFYALMAVTSERNAFGVHDPAYYQLAFDLFSRGERCALLIASYQGRDLAGVMVFRSGTNAYYFYGASSNEERNRMPTYIAQWAAIQWASEHGATRYDLWGVPDAEPDVLDAQFEQRHERLWGVYGFKRGFGGQVRRSVGAWDKVYNPLVYTLYRWYARPRNTD